MVFHDVMKFIQRIRLFIIALKIFSYIREFIYLLHLFTQGKPKQFKLVFVGALHTFEIFTCMYNFKHNTIQSY